jgi:hypothetical protein
MNGTIRTKSNQIIGVIRKGGDDFLAIGQVEEGGKKESAVLRPTESNVIGISSAS